MDNKEKVDIGIKFSSFKDGVQTFQDSYKAANGHYWQGIKINAAAPDTTKKPNDQSEDWSGVAIGTNEGSVEVHTYSGLLGDGYSVIMEVTDKDGAKHMKCDAFGPEALSRTFDWTEIIPLAK